MELTMFVDSNRSAFGSSTKLVEDIVRFLHLACFQELSSYGYHDQYRFVMLYREWFYELCTVCWKLGVPLPTLKSEIAAWRSDSVDRPLTTPDYRTLVVRDAMSEVGPSSMVSVLVVDDMPVDISKTFRALRGWPNLVLDALHVKPMDDNGVCVSECEQERLLRDQVARAIIARDPQIVLMDQGMPLTNGTAIVYAVRALQPSSKIVFVANTGGDPTLLNEAGALDNFDKGKRPGIMRHVLKNLV